jgi:hypothetical protein
MAQKVAHLCNPFRAVRPDEKLRPRHAARGSSREDPCSGAVARSAELGTPNLAVGAARFAQLTVGLGRAALEARGAIPSLVPWGRAMPPPRPPSGPAPPALPS